MAFPLLKDTVPLPQELKKNMLKVDHKNNAESDNKPANM